MTRIIPVYEPTPMMGIIAQVHIDVWKAITESADALGYTTFVELGIFRGGTGIYFVERCRRDPEFCYLGVDVHPEWMDPKFINALPGVPNAKALIGSVFDEHIKKQVADTINSHGVTMVFADHGGEVLKAGLRVYAPLLKPGDYLVIHDYPDEVDDADMDYVVGQGYEWIDRERWQRKLNTPLFRRLVR
jgi:cephalosporin hydroxylase